MIKNIPSIVFVLLASLLVPQTGWTQAAAGADTGKAPVDAKKKGNVLQLADDHPTIYTVVKGDTLWDISGKFLKQPWRWPEIWNMNRQQIKDPHWIYPGDVIKLSFDSNGRPILSFASRGEGANGTTGGTVTLEPRIRVESIGAAIPSIPLSVIGPFLSLPLVIEKDAMYDYPKIVGTEENHVVIGQGDRAYGVGLTSDKGNKWQVYRPGPAFVDPDTKEILGYEATFLGEVQVSKFGESSRLEVIKAVEEMNRGDRLTPAAESLFSSYSPHAPGKDLKGKVLYVYGNHTEGAQYSIVVLNVGKREGVEAGHVMASYRAGATVSTRDPDLTGDMGFFKRIMGLFGGKQQSYPAEVKLPDERNGLVFIFRTFDKVSYALVMSSRVPVLIGDVVTTP